MPPESPDLDSPVATTRAADAQLPVAFATVVGCLVVVFAAVAAVWSLHGLLYRQYDPVTGQLVVHSLIAPLLGLIVAAAGFLCGVALIGWAKSRPGG